MEQYNVTGMSCAACSARVEKAVSKVPGVTSCSVSLLTNSMGVEGTAAPADIVAAVEAAGLIAFRKLIHGVLLLRCLSRAEWELLQPLGLRETKQDVHILHRLTARAFDNVVDGCANDQRRVIHRMQ